MSRLASSPAPHCPPELLEKAKYHPDCPSCGSMLKPSLRSGKCHSINTDPSSASTISSLGAFLMSMPVSLSAEQKAFKMVASSPFMRALANAPLRSRTRSVSASTRSNAASSLLRIGADAWKLPLSGACRSGHLCVANCGPDTCGAFKLPTKTRSASAKAGIASGTRKRSRLWVHSVCCV